MSPLLVFTFATIVLGSAQEAKRTNRIRFPSEQNSQHQNGHHLTESESQAVPIIITAGGNGLVNAPHYILSKNPSPASPFGQIGPKGYAEGVIIPHTPFHLAQNQEFHQTVPPPIRIPYGQPQSFVMYRQEQGSQPVRPNLQQQPERHRFGMPRPHFTYNQLKQMHPNQHAHHEIFASGMALTKDAQKNPDVSSYRYSIVTNHGKPRPSHPDEFEMEITHGIPEEPFPQTKPKPRPQQTNNFNKPKIPQQKQQNIQKPLDSNRFPDFEQGIPDWQIKGGSFQDFLSQSNGFQDKKKKSSKPNVDKFPFFNNDEDFSGYDDFSDYPSIPNQNNKRFSSQRQPDFERGKGKPLFKPTRESFINENKNKKAPQKQTPSFETIKSIELVGGEMFSNENLSPNFDGFKQKPYKKPEKSHTNFNSNQRFPPKSQLKKSQKPQNNHGIEFAFNFPQRPERPQKKPQKPFNNENFDASLDLPYHKPLKKQYKQHLIQHQLPPINYNFEFDLPKGQQSKESHPSSNSGSDWIPINAPEGVVPARSYEIPAPDLSRGSYEDQLAFNRDWEAEQNNDEDEEDEHNFRFSSSETVYGVQKEGGRSGHHPGEEVVSATFRVKQ